MKEFPVMQLAVLDLDVHLSCILNRSKVTSEVKQWMLVDKGTGDVCRPRIHHSHPS